jgi:hypothetical protein
VFARIELTGLVESDPVGCRHLKVIKRVFSVRFDSTDYPDELLTAAPGPPFMLALLLKAFGATRAKTIGQAAPPDTGPWEGSSGRWHRRHPFPGALELAHTAAVDLEERRHRRVLPR